MRLTDNQIVHNLQGVHVSRTNGVMVERNTISTAKRGNGVWVVGESGQVTIRNNSIFSNDDDGISLGRGSNNDLPPPTITSYVESTRSVTGVVPASVPVGSTVEIFGDAEDEGQVRLGAAPVRERSDFLTTLGRPLPPGMNLTATVTDLDGNTSEFGQALQPQNRQPRGFVFTTTRFGNREIHRLFPGETIGTRLTSNLAADHSPALSPDRTKVAFVSDRTGDDEIWQMSSRGENPQKLTFNPASDLDPAWSPDGWLVAFASNRDGNYELLVRDLVLSQVRQLTHTAAGTVNRHPTWSPDGKRIAFVSGPDTATPLPGRQLGSVGNLEIFVMNAEGSGLVNVTDHAAADDQPSWSPDGESLAFVSDRDGNAEIYVMKPDGTSVNRVTTAAGTDTNPAWMLNGDLLLASDQEGHLDLYAAHPDGQGVRRLTLSLGINFQPNAGGH